MAEHRAVDGDGRSPSPFAPEAEGAGEPGCWNWMWTVTIIVLLAGLVLVPLVGNLAADHAAATADPLPRDSEPPARFAAGLDGMAAAAEVCGLWLLGVAVLVLAGTVAALTIADRRHDRWEQDGGADGVT